VDEDQRHLGRRQAVTECQHVRLRLVVAPAIGRQIDTDAKARLAQQIAKVFTELAGTPQEFDGIGEIAERGWRWRTGRKSGKGIRRGVGNRRTRHAAVAIEVRDGARRACEEGQRGNGDDREPSAAAVVFLRPR